MNSLLANYPADWLYAMCVRDVIQQCHFIYLFMTHIKVKINVIPNEKQSMKTFQPSCDRFLIRKSTSLVLSTYMITIGRNKIYSAFEFNLKKKKIL